MVMDTGELRAAIFERSGIAIDEHDPIMAVLAVSAQQTEEIGRRLLARTSPMRVVLVTAAAAFVFAVAGAAVGWHMGQRKLEEARAQWTRQQADPQLAALLASEERPDCASPSWAWPFCSQSAAVGARGVSKMVTASRRVRRGFQTVSGLATASEADIQQENFMRDSQHREAMIQPRSGEPGKAGDSIRQQEGARILRFKQVAALVGLGKSSIYRKVQEGTFPKPIKLGSARASGWVSTEVYDWIDEQVRRSRKAA